MNNYDKIFYLIRTLEEMLPIYRFKVSYDIQKKQYTFRTYIKQIDFPLEVIVDEEEFFDKNEFELADEIRDEFYDIIGEMNLEEVQK